MPSLVTSDPADIDTWYREQVLVHESALRGYLRRAFPVVTDPENLVQEAFVRVLQAQRETTIENVRAYLFTTVRHLALNLMRRQGIVAIDGVPEVEALGVMADQRGVPEEVSLKFELELLRQAVQSLPERCRQVLTLRKLEGLSHHEIAKRLGISEHTVEVQIGNGMRRCAKFFRQRGLLPARKENP